MLKINDLFEKNSFSKNSKNYTSAFAFSFFIGFLIAAVPHLYKFVGNYRNQLLIQEQRKIQFENKEKICKDKQSEYIKFLNLGFPETATRKFNSCMKEKCECRPRTTLID